MIDLIGFIAGFFTIISFLPQLIKSWKTRKTGDLSFLTGILLIMSAVMWTAYGMMLLLVPMIVTNIIVFISILAIILVRFFPS